MQFSIIWQCDAQKCFLKIDWNIEKILISYQISKRKFDSYIHSIPFQLLSVDMNILKQNLES